MTGNLHIFKNPEELARNLSGQLQSWVDSHSGEIYHIAISGGKTPELLFSVLADEYPTAGWWQKVHFWWVDERMVAPDDVQSNYGVAHRLLFSGVEIPAANIHRIKGELEAYKESKSYSDQINAILPQFDGFPRFDLILLGMGDDGHTASIFPGQMHLLTSDEVCAVAIHPQSQQKRVTLTGKTINRASKLCFLITGSNKAERMNEIFRIPEKASRLPAAYIQPVKGELDWYVDKEASAIIC